MFLLRFLDFQNSLASFTLFSFLYTVHFVLHLPFIDVDNEYSMDYTTTNATSYAAAQSAVSPSAAVALDAGTDSQKLQLMKLSFFVDDDCKSGKCSCKTAVSCLNCNLFLLPSVISELPEGRDSPDQIVPHQLYLRNRLQAMSTTSSLRSPSMTGVGPASALSSRMDTHSETSSKQPQFSVDSTTRLVVGVAQKIIKPTGPKSVPLILKPKVAMVKMPRTMIPLSESILTCTNTKNCVADVALFHSRKFRIGWAAKTSLFTLNTLENCQSIQQRGFYSVIYNFGTFSKLSFLSHHQSTRLKMLANYFRAVRRTIIADLL